MITREELLANDRKNIRKQEEIIELFEDILEYLVEEVNYMIDTYETYRVEGSALIVDYTYYSDESGYDGCYRRDDHEYSGECEIDIEEVISFINDREAWIVAHEEKERIEEEKRLKEEKKEKAIRAARWEKENEAKERKELKRLKEKYEN